jgi:nitroreductase
LQTLEAIRTRRSLGKQTDQVPSRQDIETILDAGIWAPNHHLTIPWRFVVIAGDVRKEFGKIGAQSKLRRMETEGRDTTGEEEKLIAKAFRSPVIIAVGIEPDPTRPELDEIASGAAAAQNMLLAAHDLGLAAIWRSGDAVFDPAVAAWLGLSERGKIIGFIYLGYPAVLKEPGRRPAIAEVTEWRGWSDDNLDLA